MPKLNNYEFSQALFDVIFSFLRINQGAEPTEESLGILVQILDDPNTWRQLIRRYFGYLEELYPKRFISNPKTLFLYTYEERQESECYMLHLTVQAWMGLLAGENISHWCTKNGNAAYRRLRRVLVVSAGHLDLCILSEEERKEALDWAVRDGNLRVVKNILNSDLIEPRSIVGIFRTHEFKINPNVIALFRDYFQSKKENTLKKLRELRHTNLPFDLMNKIREYYFHFEYEAFFPEQYKISADEIQAALKEDLEVSSCLTPLRNLQISKSIDEYPTICSSSAKVQRYTALVRIS